MKKKNLLPILLIGGAAIALIIYLRSRKPKGQVIIPSGPEDLTQAEFEALPSYDVGPGPEPKSIIDAGTNLINALFKKDPGAAARRSFVKKAVKTGTSRKAAKAAVKRLQTFTPKSFGGFDDNVLF